MAMMFVMTMMATNQDWVIERKGVAGGREGVAKVGGLAVAVGNDATVSSPTTVFDCWPSEYDCCTQTGHATSVICVLNKIYVTLALYSLFV